MANSQDHNGPEFSNIKQEVSENTLSYSVLIPNKDTSNQQRRQQLESVRQVAQALCRDLTRDYIWQRETFDLQLRTEGDLLYLHGTTDYGDAIEDEWLIVYLMRRLSKTDANIWIRMSDSDGEFLLVEAAKVLPKWLSPEIDQNRVWIHDGKLLIIPYKQDDPESSPSLSLQAAVETIKQQPNSLLHSEFIEAEAFYRLGKYPEQIKQSIHHSVLTIPRSLAFVLHCLPKAIAPGVEAFYVRDALALKPLYSPTAPLTFSPEDLVTVSVRFSKVLFAQLRSQRFEPPPRWQSTLQKAKGAGERVFQQIDMGMKLTCGFEMLAMNAADSNNRIARELAIVLEDLGEDGAEALPSDEVIKSWPYVSRDDPEDWLDINYEDFERVLEGGSTGQSGQQFGHAEAQDNLKKIVARFEAFLNDDKAGLDGAEIDDMDVDNDTDDDEDSEGISHAEDRELSFDDDEFSKMMREMMGLPPLPPGTAKQIPPTSQGEEKMGKINEPGANAAEKPAESPDDEEHDAEEIRKLMAQMEAELKGHGALKLERGNRLDNQPNVKETPEVRRSKLLSEGSEEDVGDDIEYNLARNLLESFKSQGGMSGPAGNLLGAMGFQLPRDEDEDDTEQKGR